MVDRQNNFVEWVIVITLHHGTVLPFMVHRCTELSKLTSPSLWNLTVDSAARFFQNFGTRASFHRDEEVWLEFFNLKSF